MGAGARPPHAALSMSPGRSHIRDNKTGFSVQDSQLDGSSAVWRRSPVWTTWWTILPLTESVNCVEMCRLEYKRALLRNLQFQCSFLQAWTCSEVHTAASSAASQSHSATTTAVYPLHGLYVIYCTAAVTQDSSLRPELKHPHEPGQTQLPYFNCVIRN